MTGLLRADSVGKAFGARRVLTAASLEAYVGRITALLGRNGAGKSTLLKVAAGRLAPDYGTVHFKGVYHRRARLHTLADAGLFFLPDRDLLSHAFTLRQHLDAVASRFGRGDPDEAAEAAGVGDRMDRRPHTLSGGERRRAELAVALARAPDCLLADEPYRGIAPHDAEVLSAIFRRLAAQGCGVVITGHEAPTLLDVAGRVVWCTDGTTYDLGPPASALEEWRFRQAYLGRA